MKKIIFIAFIIFIGLAACKKKQIEFKPETKIIQVQGHDIRECFGDNQPVVLDATTAGAISYQWSTGAATPTINVEQENLDYTVTVTTMDTTFVYDGMVWYCGTTFFVPNSFTPNGDWINDFFGPKGTQLDFSKYQMKIYNHQVKCVFSTRDYTELWNGCFHNNEDKRCPIGYYYYYFEYTTNTGEDKTKSGMVELLN